MSGVFQPNVFQPNVFQVSWPVLPHNLYVRVVLEASMSAALAVGRRSVGMLSVRPAGTLGMLSVRPADSASVELVPERQAEVDVL
jgi:hypothetical protein